MKKMAKKTFESLVIILVGWFWAGMISLMVEDKGTRQIQFALVSIVAALLIVLATRREK